MQPSGLLRNMRNVVHNYTEVEIKVREATSNDPWGPRYNYLIGSEFFLKFYRYFSIIQYCQIMLFFSRCRMNYRSRSIIKNFSSSIMAEISDLTYQVQPFPEIMAMLWKRLSDHGKNWRHVYKSLMLLGC